VPPNYCSLLVVKVGLWRLQYPARLAVRSSLANIELGARRACLQHNFLVSRSFNLSWHIGPGYTYEETHSFFTLGASTIVPLFNRNQGPIAEAEARRKEAAAAFVERQAQVIARSERALAVYTATLKELSEAESLRKLQENQLQITQQAIRSGTDIRLNLDSVQIQILILERARIDALVRAQRALGELEDAVQKPLDPGGVFNITPESPALHGHQ